MTKLNKKHSAVKSKTRGKKKRRIIRLGELSARELRVNEEIREREILARHDTACHPFSAPPRRKPQGVIRAETLLKTRNMDFDPAMVRLQVMQRREIPFPDRSTGPRTFDEETEEYLADALARLK